MDIPRAGRQHANAAKIIENRLFESSRPQVSTVGVAPSLKKLTREHPDVRVALSLHAPTQTLRERIVPASKRWPLDELLEALDDHLSATEKRHKRSASGLMIEYVLLKGVNDRDEDADALAALLRGRNVMLNLIPCVRRADRSLR